MRPHVFPHRRPSMAAKSAPPQLRGAQARAYDGTDQLWQTAEPAKLEWDSEKDTRAQTSSRSASSHAQTSSAAQPACAAARLSEKSRVQKFLAALDNAAYECKAFADAALLHELSASLSSGKLLLQSTDDVWDLDKDEREDIATAKLDQLIELVVNIRTAWLATFESEDVREIKGRCLEPLGGELHEFECEAAVRRFFKPMSNEKKAEYDF